MRVWAGGARLSAELQATASAAASWTDSRFMVRCSQGISVDLASEVPRRRGARSTATVHADSLVRMLSASSITLPLVGWTAVPDGADAWTNASGDVLSTHFFDLKPDLPAALSADLSRNRAYYRKILGDNGAIVEVERITAAGHQALRTIIKLKQEPTGMTYVAAVTVPFEECSFVARVQCMETGVTGLRDTIVAMKLDAIGADGWMRDPYDASYRNPVLSNRSDEVEWDVFPDHPLSRARRYLVEIERLELPKEIESLAPFSGHPPPPLLRRLLGKN